MDIARLNKLLEKTTDWDKDERYMATNDLCTTLTKDIKIDENMEQRICAAVLKQLDDQSNDVQSVAVKCLAIIIKKVQQAQIGDICRKLSSLILDGTGALRDVYSIGLKTLIADVPDSMGGLVSDKLTGSLLLGITTNTDKDVTRECLDIMADLLRRFGHLNSDAHTNTMNAVVQHLQSDNTVIRKRATACLGSLAVVSSDSLLNSLVDILLKQIEAAEQNSTAGTQATRTLIQTIGTISRTVGHRLGRYVDCVVPLFLRFCGDASDENQQTDAANELRETCFAGLESFVLRCPREIIPFVKDIVSVSTTFCKYDPNYVYDDEDDAMDIADNENDDECGVINDDDDEEDFGEDDYAGSDDDDTSWKVRKAAVNVINTSIQSYSEMIRTLYAICGDCLVRRFKEREENVRLVTINCFATIVQTIQVLQDTAHSGTTSTNADGITAASGVATNTCADDEWLRNELKIKVPHIVAVSLSHLSGSSLKTKSAIFSLLRKLVIALKGGLDQYIGKLFTAINKCLIDKNQSTLKLEALSFTRTVLEYHSAVILQPNLASLVDTVATVASEDWYKVIAEALRVLTTIIPIIRPLDVDSGVFDDSFTPYAQYAIKIYSAVSPRLQSLDMDYEIKECAILAAGKLFSYTGDILSEQFDHVLGIFRKRLDNETTRSATLKSLTVIANSPIQPDLSQFLVDTATELSLLLKQANRTLRQQALQCLHAIICASNTQLNEQLAAVILGEVAELIVDSDLHLCHLAILLAQGLFEKSVVFASAPLFTHVYPKLLVASQSAQIQGPALSALIELLELLAATKTSQVSIGDMFTALYSTTSIKSGQTLSKQSLFNVSKCIAGVVKASSTISTPIIHSSFISTFVDKISTKFSDEPHRQLALLSLGEVGQKFDLSALPDINTMILQCLTDDVPEDTKSSAAYALGHMAIGNMNMFLPVILQSAESHRLQYLLLTALKEVALVVAQLKLDFSLYLDSVLALLLQQANSDEESIRVIVAECLGVLTTVANNQMIPVLLQQLAANKSIDVEPNESHNDSDGNSSKEDNTCMRSRRTIADSLRFALSHHDISQDVLGAITNEMRLFLALLCDADLEVKRAALLMVNTAVHHYPHTVSAQFGTTILPVLLQTLQIKLERVVDLGPFKHRVDDNLPLRKIALTCIETVLDTSPYWLDATALMAIMPIVLADKDDMKLQAHQVLGKLCQTSPSAVAAMAEQLIPLLNKTISKRPNPDAAAAGGPEVERAIDLIRSAVRAILEVDKIKNSAQIGRKWTEFATKVRADEYIAAIILSIEQKKALFVGR